MTCSLITGRMTTNRFDFLRLLFASGVFIYHLIVLAELSEPFGTYETAWGAVAELCIQGFFVISGTLVYGSWARTQALGTYAEKRFRRLYPAYALIILLPAALSLGISGEFEGVFRYLGANLAFLNFLAPDLPGLFEGQRLTAVNGALWTLKIEVMFYLILPFLGWLISRAGRWKWALLAAIYVGAELWRSILTGMDNAQIARQLPGQMSFFATGIALWMLKDRVEDGRYGPMLAIGGALIGLSVFPYLEGLRAAGLGLAIAALAFMPGPQLNAARFGDISYGVYITHFPIVQMLVAFGIFAMSPWLGVAAALILVIAASLALWRFVERPALRADSHYRRAETALDTSKQEG